MPPTRASTAAEPVVVVVQDEVRREHSIKGSLDAKMKGTSLPAIEVSLSWNNASTVKTTSKTRLVPGHYPQLPPADPTPAVPYPQPAVSSAVSTASVVSVAGPSQTQLGATSSGCSAQPRPDSGLGTSDSEATAYRTCVESESDDSDFSDHQMSPSVQMSPSAPTDDEASDGQPIWIPKIIREREVLAQVVTVREQAAKLQQTAHDIRGPTEVPLAAQADRGVQLRQAVLPQAAPFQVTASAAVAPQADAGVQARQAAPQPQVGQAGQAENPAQAGQSAEARPAAQARPAVQAVASPQRPPAAPQPQVGQPGQRPTAQARPAAQARSAAQARAAAQAAPTGQAPQAAQAVLGPQPRQGQAARGHGRVRQGRGRRQRRVRKREWEESEEELSPVDDEASFPSRISPRNKKPFQGYSNF